uniref:Raptor N-terminal CASPase-like domain-containing protein n=1 Tax=Acrobeloides nanus TaxID=290746 RepID=A0A914DRW0_9BILA
MDTPEKVWFHEARHVEEIDGPISDIPDKDAWRKIKERMKTVSVALVLCLNIGVDPPDVQKQNPCARKEAWVDPAATSPQKAAAKIAQNLQINYGRLQPRARYKSAIDPTVDCVRKLCSSMRRNAKEERVLFHFNGHGVPKPTEAGEIWVFNKHITQYIPLSIYDLQNWMDCPSVYIWDCNSAGTIVTMFNRFAEDHLKRWKDEYNDSKEQRPFPEMGSFLDEDERAKAIGMPPKPQYKDCIQLAACSAGEILPQSPDLPADLFTCCLTTPIQTSLLWYMLKTGTKDKYPPNIIEEIPGILTDRRTLLGELNWIFTAITDTIAWNSLPKEVFQRLFRQDLLIASLFRSFLLAERIMGENNCKVVSQPELPSVFNHPLWEYWEYTLDLCLNNMYNMLVPKLNIIQVNRIDCFVKTSLKHSLLIDITPTFLEMDYSYSWFFIEQLQAFEVWLKFAVNKKEPPQQLPVVLQVLLSQVHRVRALELLAKFVDLGSWAVVAALTVGIYPYVLKLLQCGTKELRPALAFIWAKILSVDPICQEELVKDNGYFYFIQILNDPTVSNRIKVVPAFVMATLIYNNYRPAQEKLIQSDYVTLCTELLSNEQDKKCRMLYLWLLIGLGRLWAEYNVARWHAVRTLAFDRVTAFLKHDLPECRAAAVYALGSLVHNRSENNEHATDVDYQLCDKLCENCTFDGSVLVRTELIAAIQWVIIDFANDFAKLCIELDKKSQVKSSGDILNDLKMEPLEPFEEADEDTRSSRVSLSRIRSFRSNNKTKPRHNRSLLLGSDHLVSKDTQRARLHGQMHVIEKKPFKTPHERIWFSLLKLYFDPIESVSQLSKKLIDHVSDLASKLKLAQLKWEGGSPPEQKATFMIGSPVPSSSADKRLTSIENRLKPSASDVDLYMQDHIETGYTSFTPKRELWAKTQSGKYTKNEGGRSADVPMQGLVSTRFVDWCTKTFTEPIYKTIYEDVSTAKRNSLVDSDDPYTFANLTDWALHSREGLKQKTNADLQSFKSESVKCETQHMQIRADRTVTSMVWSFLRPYVFTCDGETVSTYNYTKEKSPLKSCQFTAYKEPLLHDTISEMLSANELTHELLITGTRRGLILVWDPMFSEHSHDILNEPKLVTSAYLLNDQERLGQNDRSETLYRWDQDCGKIVCAGNVRICRIWDAAAEKPVKDLMLFKSTLDARNSMTCHLSVNLSNNLISCGFENGQVGIYDIRIPMNESQIMRLRNFRSPIVGGAILKDGQTSIYGSREGEVKVFEHRMFQEPIAQFSALSENGKRSAAIMQRMEVQVSGEIVACDTSDSYIRLYDISGKKSLSQIRFGDTNSQLAFSTAVRFHPERVLFGIATKDNGFAVYGVPNL